MTDTASLAYELATELESVVRGAPGVDTLYPTAPLVARIVGAIVSEFTQREAASDLVTITMGDAGLIVSAAVRVVGSEPATDVCRLVFDSIATVLAAHSPVPIDTIKVTVASIG